MSKADLHQRLKGAYEITLSVKGRKSGRDISRPVWFVHEGNTLTNTNLLDILIIHHENIRNKREPIRD